MVYNKRPGGFPFHIPLLPLAAIRPDHRAGLHGGPRDRQTTAGIVRVGRLPECACAEPAQHPGLRTATRLAGRGCPAPVGGAGHQVPRGNPHGTRGGRPLAAGAAPRRWRRGGLPAGHSRHESRRHALRAEAPGDSRHLIAKTALHRDWIAQVPAPAARSAAASLSGALQPGRLATTRGLVNFHKTMKAGRGAAVSNRLPARFSEAGSGLA